MLPSSGRPGGIDPDRGYLRVRCKGICHAQTTGRDVASCTSPVNEGTGDICGWLGPAFERVTCDTHGTESPSRASTWGRWRHWWVKSPRTATPS